MNDPNVVDLLRRRAAISTGPLADLLLWAAATIDDLRGRIDRAIPDILELKRIVESHD